MKDNFAKCLPEILKHEGGWADHPRDPGGATMKGITIGTYAQWKGRKVSKDELRNITDAEVAAIYKRNYWDKVRADDLPSGLDLVAFDGAVNSGPSRGAKWLQQALGVAADGQVGSDTLTAAAKQPAADVIARAIGYRLAFLKSLSTWPTFGKGWQRRVDGVKAKAISMATDTKPLILKPSDAIEPPFRNTRTPKPEPAPVGGIVGAVVALIALIAAAFGWKG